MNKEKYIFSQVVEYVSGYEFEKCVERYNGNKNIYNLTCRDQFLSLMFGQLTALKSLRGIVLCLNAHPNQLYHLGFRARKFVLSTLSRANQFRDWRIHRDFTEYLIGITRRLYLYDNEFSIELENSVYALDSTVIDLCLATFKWAYFELQKSAVKIHTQLDLKGTIPSFFLITKAKTHDVNFLDNIEFEKDAIYIMDRGYLDFKRLMTVNRHEAFFIVRSKKSLSFKRIYSNKVDKATGLRCDQIIKLKHFYSRKHYPEKLRRIKYVDRETNRSYIYLTNNFNIPAKTIANLYKHRWQIELFFKWIKQHLKIQVFWGYSFNAVKTQICIAISTFLLVAIMKKKLKIKRNLYEILQILQVSQFEKTPLTTLIAQSGLQTLENNHQKRLKPGEF
ncbi:IS4 family transposase [Patescibacteria group bacterium]|nr:IS4 family transposase [Patescibacteria group bacterium]